MSQSSDQTFKMMHQVLFVQEVPRCARFSTHHEQSWEDELPGLDLILFEKVDSREEMTKVQLQIDCPRDI